MGGEFAIEFALVCVYFILFGGVPCQEQTSGHNLEYVMTVLEQRGLLQKIDPSLLSRVQNVVHKQKQNNVINKQSLALPNLAHSLAGARQSLALPNLGHSLAGARQKGGQTSGSDNIDKLGESHLSKINNARTRLFQTREPDRKFGGRLSNDCHNYKKEILILKQLLALNRQKDKNITERIDKLTQSKQNHKNMSVQKLQANSRLSTISYPLNFDLQETISQNEKMLNKIENKLSYSQVLVTPTPTISTIFYTSSYEATISKNYTREIPLIVRGQRVMTTLIDPTVTVR